jgi:sugar (pentulose or hexulose) kinase
MALLGAQRAGLHLQRFLDLLGIGEDRERLRTLDAQAAELTDGGGIRVEGFEDDRASLLGIGPSPTPAQVWHAALAAMSRRSAEILAAVEQGAGPTRRLVIGGGWARSAAVRAAKAAALGPYDHPQVHEPGCRGAALLAAVAAGHYPHVSALPPPVAREEGT